MRSFVIWCLKRMKHHCIGVPFFFLPQPLGSVFELAALGEPILYFFMSFSTLSLMTTISKKFDEVHPIILS